MDQTKYDEARRLYDAGDFRGAAKGFLASAGRGTDGNGSAYHMAGNSLMKLRRWKDAVAVYGHALRDQAYTKRGAVYANLGRAYYQLAEYADAVDAYSLSLNESDYRTPHKALTGMADSLLQAGKVEDAAVAYRQAALDPGNPDPGKALVNLGLCFMALGRPSDAIESYRAALGFDNYQNRGKALANMAIAEAALGKYDDAVRDFEKATQFHGYRLSATAADVYEQSKNALGPSHEMVEGWETGQMLPIEVASARPMTGPAEGWGTGDLETLPPIGTAPMPPASVPYGDEHAAAHAAAALGFGDEAAVEDFFTRTEDDMKEADRAARKQARARKHSERNPWVLVASIVGAIVVVMALVFALYYFGFGWPMQSQTVNALLTAHMKGDSVSAYWVAVPNKDVTKEMAKIPPLAAFKLDSSSTSGSTAVAYVTVTPPKGSPLRYRVTLAREGVGWKVTGIDNDWQSTGQ